ncbi:MAG: hypothetical protein KA297_18080, partial [Kofleriaceae bacterium]|nr:hypothetical protein [Kofleriaceae bacterium]
MATGPTDPPGGDEPATSIEMPAFDELPGFDDEADDGATVAQPGGPAIAAGASRPPGAGPVTPPAPATTLSDDARARLARARAAVGRVSTAPPSGPTRPVPVARTGPSAPARPSVPSVPSVP